MNSLPSRCSQPLVSSPGQSGKSFLVCGVVGDLLLAPLSWAGVRTLAPTGLASALLPPCPSFLLSLPDFPAESISSESTGYCFGAAAISTWLLASTARFYSWRYQDAQSIPQSSFVLERDCVLSPVKNRYHLDSNWTMKISSWRPHSTLSRSNATRFSSRLATHCFLLIWTWEELICFFLLVAIT